MGWYWNPLGVLGLAVGASHLILAAFVFFTGSTRPQARRLALVLMIDSTGGFLGGGIVYLTDTHSIAYAAQATTYAGSVLVTLAYLHFLGSLPAPASRPLRWKPLAWIYLAIAVAWFALFIARTELFLADVAPSPYSRLEGVHGPLLLPVGVLPGVGAVVLGLVVALSMWLQSPRGSAARRQGAAYAVAFGWRDLTFLFLFLAVFVLNIQSVRVIWTVSMGFAIYPFILAYALLKHQLFDLDLKIKWTLSRGTVAAAFVAAFLIVSKLTEAWASEVFGQSWVVGAVVAALLLFALSPLQRLGDRLADQAMPNVRDTEEYLTVRKREVYQAALEGALVDGAISERERDILARLQDQLGLSATEARTIEREVAPTAA